MSIFIDASTKVLVQGATGSEGSFWTKHMVEMGTNVVAGVTPGKEGMSLHIDSNPTVPGVPIFHTVRRATLDHLVDAAMLFVPPRFVKDAVFEALDAGIRKIVTVADGIPLHEALQIRYAAQSCGATVIGGNTSGAISPGKAMMGMFPYWIERVYKPGRIGVMTRSGSLTNEVTAMIVAGGFGVSSLIGVGGDSVPGTRFSELLPAFQADPDTDGVVVIGELGGTMEEEVADAMCCGSFTKPLVAFIGGRHAPAGKRMGHAGAIMSGGKGSSSSKMAALRSAGALVAEKPSLVGEYLRFALDVPKTYAKNKAM
jgi:succinyl-CoA synthetase alpha subunit